MGAKRIRRVTFFRKKNGDKVLVTKIDRLARSIVDLNSNISSLNSFEIVSE